MLHPVSATRRVLEAGKGPGLVSALRLVAEATAGDGLRYPPAAVRDLEIAVTCRTYSPSVHELCHLVAAAAALDRGRYERVLWPAGPTTAASMRAAFETAIRRGTPRPGIAVTIGPSGLGFDLQGSAYAVPFARMPYLAALLEFLVDALGFERIDGVFRAMLAAGPDAAAVGAAANTLSRQVYDWLADELPPAQTQRKLHALLTFLGSRLGAGFTPEVVDDACILDFWCAADEAGEDFRTFAGVLSAFNRLLQLLAVGDTRIAEASAVPVGSDREAGEIDIDARRAAALAEAIESGDDPFALLASAPAAAVKFLNARERERLAFLVASPELVRRLPLSVLRGESVAPWQARLTEARRRRADCGAILDAGPAEGYADTIARLRALADHLARARLAGFAALAGPRPVAALALLSSLRPDIDLAPLRTRLAGRRDLDAAALGRLDDPGVVGQGIAAALLDARRALKGIARQGFSDPSIEESIEGFEAAVEPLAGIARRLEAFLGRVAALRWPEGDAAAQFAADRAVFAGRLRTLYGEAP